jgi:glycosyltransferase involved in cell wall biosynthesis
MKRVLIVSYYWPPAGGGGVQRWLKMTKYLHLYGWKATVFTPSNAEVAGLDDSLVAEVHPEVTVVKSPIWEPYDLYKKVLGIKKDEKIYSGFIRKDKKKSKFAAWATNAIRGNFFIPDARMYWIKPGSKFLIEYLKTHKVDAIISTGPPHSMHLIARRVHKETGIPWVADFRDPWTQFGYYKEIPKTWFADLYNKLLEKKVVNTATKIVTVSKSWVDDFKKITDRRDVQLITNGYDPADFEGVEVVKEKKFTIIHLGSMDKYRNLPTLWKTLHAIAAKNDGFKRDLKLALIGPTDGAVLSELAELGLGDNVEEAPFIPHDEAVKRLKSSHLLLLSINNSENQSGIIPGKMYEYIGSGTPILCIGPESGDSIDIMNECVPNSTAAYSDTAKMEQIILEAYDAFTIGKDLHHLSPLRMQYSRKELAGKYAQLLNTITT